MVDRRARRLEENRRQAALILEKRIAEARRRQPMLYQEIDSAEFRAWWEAITGAPWDRSLEADPYKMISEVEIVRSAIEWRAQAERDAAAKAELNEMMVGWLRDKNASKLTASKRRRFMVLYATPKWADIEKIKAIYAERTERSSHEMVAYHVDHIIPIQGKRVCGLHVENNLQLLMASDNIRKNNKFDCDEFSG